jgi:rod shape determining protein RodA
MSTRNDLDAGSYDLITIFLFILLVAIGWTMIFAVEYLPETYTGLLNLQKNYGKQLMFIAVSAVIFGIVQLIDAKLLEIFAIIFYGFCMLLLVGVLFTKPINGSTSWYNVGGFSLQPSEFAKMATCLLLSSYLGRTEVRVQVLEHLGRAAAIIALPMALVLRQGDLGSTLVYTSFAIMLFRAGLNGIIYMLGLHIVALSIIALKFDDLSMTILILIIAGISVLAFAWQQNRLQLLGALLVIILGCLLYNEGQIWLSFGLLSLVFGALLVVNASKKWQLSLIVGLTFGLSIAYAFSVSTFVNNVLMPHQQERIWVWLRPEKCDPQGALYNVEQSKYAIGSGGIVGKGFLQGERTKLDYVPEQSTDFIFCTVGEEWGFLGTATVILLYLGLLFRILIIAERQRSNFNRFYAYGAAGILFFHFLINIGMTIGLIPVVGIPLPLVSYGGSSLMAFTLLVAVLIKLDSSRTF